MMRIVLVLTGMMIMAGGCTTVKHTSLTQYPIITTAQKPDTTSVTCEVVTVERNADVSGVGTWVYSRLQFIDHNRNTMYLLEDAILGLPLSPGQIVELVLIDGHLVYAVRSNS